ncbi:hypothetical protein [Burkholderia anthina]|uniref:hypothetical protein n=1 Tax=Burkholderia anthina TaxID=179879 RepID=UPI00158D1F73|nr:hypothetical protein [Burkholderia anthina]
MPLDTSIPLQAKTPEFNPLQQALQVAQFRYMNANGQAMQQQFDANRAVSAAYQQATDPNTGRVDNNKLLGIISQDPRAAYNMPTIVKGLNDQTEQQIRIDNSQLDNAKQHLGWAYQVAGAIASNPNATTDDVLSAVGLGIKNGQITPQMAGQAISDMPGLDAPKGALQAWAARHVAQIAGAAKQLDVMLPSVSTLDKGGSIDQVATDKISGVPAVTKSFTKTLDPATASTPTPAYVNGQPGNIPRSQFAVGGDQPPPIPTVAQPSNMPTSNGQAAPMPSGPLPGAPRGFVATGPAMGVQDANAGTVKTMNDHWDALSGTAGNAQRNIGIANNIQQLANTANTGFGSDRKATVNAILAAFGAKASGNTATDNDLLNKNVAQLNISSLPGGTDAAKALQAAATPGAKMQPEAIKEAAQYIVGVNQMALAEQNYLQGYKLNNDATGYTQAKTQFDQNADPRIWAWASMQDPAKRATYAKQLQAQDPGIVQKIHSLEQMGVIK